MHDFCKAKKCILLNDNDECEASTSAKWGCPYSARHVFNWMRENSAKEPGVQADTKKMCNHEYIGRAVCRHCGEFAPW